MGPIHFWNHSLECIGTYGYIELTLAFDGKSDEMWWVSLRGNYHHQSSSIPVGFLVIVVVPFVQEEKPNITWYKSNWNQNNLQNCRDNIFHLINLSSFIHNENLAMTELCSIQQGCLLNPTASRELACDVLHRPDFFRGVNPRQSIR